MLRLSWPSGTAASRLLSEDDLIGELQALAAHDFADIAAGPLVIEALDERARVVWSGHYRSATALHALLRELRYARDARASEQRPPTQ